MLIRCFPCAALAALSLLAAACSRRSSDEVPSLKLSAEQRAWQPYQTGQTLQFHNDASGKTRSYLITGVTDQLEERTESYTLRQKTLYYYQHVQVRAQRTDSIVYRPVLAARTDSTVDVDLILDMRMRRSEEEPEPRLEAQANWVRTFGVLLPIDSLNQHTFRDSRVLQLLPSLVLGNRSYQQVVVCRYQGNEASTRRFKVIRKLYLTREQGVVGFEEDGTGLWYRR